MTLRMEVIWKEAPQFAAGLANTVWLCGAAMALSTVGCAAPRVISGITSSRDQIKFLYQEGSSQGVLKCKIAADASLSECHQMVVTIQD